MPRFNSITEIIDHIRGKFPDQVFVGASYSKADLIADLEQVERDLLEELEQANFQLPVGKMADLFFGRKKSGDT